MRDVAARAGVSVKTVSRVVNAEPHTRPEIVQRVRVAIDELNWVPNGSARTLRTGRTGVIGIGVPELRRPYLAALVEALVTETDRRGMQAAVEPTHSDPDRLHTLLDARGRTFDGLVLVRPDGDFPIDGALEERPVVVVHGARELREVDRVDEDVVEAAALVARHLAVMGRTRPALLGPDRALVGAANPTGPSDVLRAALSAAGIDATAVPVVPLGSTWDRIAGARAAAELIERGSDVDALLCVNDEVALGALMTLAAQGIDVPGRIAVIGYDDLDDGWFSTPSLTTIDPGPLRLARAALELLADRLAGTAPAQARTVVSSVELVRRESTLGAQGR